MRMIQLRVPEPKVHHGLDGLDALAPEIHLQDGPPPEDLGMVGDIYLDAKTGDVYEKIRL